MTARALTAKNLLLTASPMMIASNIFGTVLWTATIVTTWGTRGAWIAPVLWFLAVTSNIACYLFLSPRWGVLRAEHARAALNVVLHLPIGILTGWTLLGWLFLPFLTGQATTPPLERIGVRVPLTVASFAALALASGARWQEALVFAGVSLYFYVFLRVYLRLTTELLRENDQALRTVKAAQRAAIAQEKLASIGQLAAGVAHEINNPMCFVTANVADLLADLRAAEHVPAELLPYRDEILDETLDGIARVNSIVDDLRRFARGEPEIHVALDLTKELASAVRMAKTQLRPGQRLLLEAPPTMPMIGMPRQLGQAVLNLIVNGLQALGARGEVRVSATELEHDYRIVISDDGAGMTEDTKRHLFEPFFTTKEQRGVGIGLAVVSGVVAAHGGTIEVESTLGRGSRFRVLLPKRAAAASQAALRAATASPTGAGGRGSSYEPPPGGATADAADEAGAA